MQAWALLLAGDTPRPPSSARTESCSDPASQDDEISASIPPDNGIGHADIAERARQTPHLHTAPRELAIEWWALTQPVHHDLLPVQRTMSTLPEITGSSEQLTDQAKYEAKTAEDGSYKASPGSSDKKHVVTRCRVPNSDDMEQPIHGRSS